MKILMLRIVTLTAAFVLGIAAVTAMAEDLGAVKTRMNQRLGQIDQLKASGAIGENNRGFVEVRGGGGDAAAVVSAENQDRQTVYAAIGKQQGVSPDEVGRVRAKKIAAASAPGVWIQKDDGTWVKK